jgi:hypothetical protein
MLFEDCKILQLNCILLFWTAFYFFYFAKNANLACTILACKLIFVVCKIIFLDCEISFLGCKILFQDCKILQFWVAKFFFWIAKFFFWFAKMIFRDAEIIDPPNNCLFPNNMNHKKMRKFDDAEVCTGPSTG